MNADENSPNIVDDENRIGVADPDWVLSNDGREFISRREAKFRTYLEFFYRFLVAVFCSAQLFDFLFNPIWMHGYIWSLNLNLDVDMSDKSAGFILDHQLAVVGYAERLLHAILSTCAVILILWLAGYGLGNKTVWNLLSLSMAFGAASGLARCAQMKHRLYPAIHECFYVYLHFFVVGFCMTWRCLEKFPKSNSLTQNDIIANEEYKKQI